MRLIDAFAAFYIIGVCIRIRWIIGKIYARAVACHSPVTVKGFSGGNLPGKLIEDLFKSRRSDLVAALDHGGRGRDPAFFEKIQYFCADIVRTRNHREQQCLLEGYFPFPCKIRFGVHEEFRSAIEQ